MSKKPVKHGQVETTGHEWDGIEELNNPLPRWWVWVFYATIVWGLWYTIAYPAWPLVRDATAGYLGYSTRAEVAADIAAVNERNAALNEQLASADLFALAGDTGSDLHSYAVNMGEAVFAANCSQCHGAGAGGVQAGGYPSLLDNDWIWGGRIDEIAWTVANGIRNEQSPDARGFGGNMPAFGVDGTLSDEEIGAVVQHVLAISGQEHDAAQAAAGAELYLANCASCHGDDGKGSLTQTRANEDPAALYPDGEMLGAPNLTDAIWLYGGSAETITATIVNGRAGVMPAWSAEWRVGSGLDQAEVNAVAAYVHQLGGGE